MYLLLLFLITISQTETGGFFVNFGVMSKKKKKNTYNNNINLKENT